LLPAECSQYGKTAASSAFDYSLTDRPAAPVVQDEWTKTKDSRSLSSLPLAANHYASPHPGMLWFPEFGPISGCLMASSHLRCRRDSTQLNCSAGLANSAWSVHSSVTSQC